MTTGSLVITILGSGLVNTIVSAVANYYQGDDVRECAIGGLLGGLAGGVVGSLVFMIFGVTV